MKTVLKYAAALTLTGALALAAATPGEARNGRNAALIGGFAAGAVIGAAAANANNGYYYGPGYGPSYGPRYYGAGYAHQPRYSAPGYAYEPAYSAPVYAYEPGPAYYAPRHRSPSQESCGYNLGNQDC